MVLFEPVLLRLKEQLGVSTDKEVASILGLGDKAFNARKKRDSFPEDKLLALHAKRPDLNLDIAYILIGERAVVHAVMGAVKAAAAIVDRLGGTKAERQARLDALLGSVVQSTRSSLSDEEQLVIARYRLASSSTRNEVLRLLLSRETSSENGTKSQPAAHAGGRVISHVKQQINAPVSGGVAGRDLVHKGRKKKNEAGDQQ